MTTRGKIARVPTMLDMPDSKRMQASQPVNVVAHGSCPYVQTISTIPPQSVRTQIGTRARELPAVADYALPETILDNALNTVAPRAHTSARSTSASMASPMTSVTSGGVYDCTAKRTVDVAAHTVTPHAMSAIHTAGLRQSARIAASVPLNVVYTTAPKSAPNAAALGASYGCAVERPTAIEAHASAPYSGTASGTLG